MVVDQRRLIDVPTVDLLLDSFIEVDWPPQKVALFDYQLVHLCEVWFLDLVSILACEGVAVPFAKYFLLP